MATLHCKSSPKPALPLARASKARAEEDLYAKASSLTPYFLDLPPVKPSAIALGIVFNQLSSAAVLAPLFGDTYHRARAADSKEEFFKSREAATAAASYGSSILGSAIQTYGVGALINATGTLSYKGAAYLGSLIFFASAGPSVSLHDTSPSLLANLPFRSLPLLSPKSDLSIPWPLVF